MWRNFASNMFTIVILLLAAGAGVIFWGQRQYTEQGPLAEAICLQVAPGSTMSRVAGDLVDQGAISNATIYRLGADYSERSGLLKAGSFLIDAGSSMEDRLESTS